MPSCSAPRRAASRRRRTPSRPTSPRRTPIASTVSTPWRCTWRAAFDVRGPVITISTACSSAAVALSIAAALLPPGLARRVLCGGADALCRLTFHGFRQLQLVAPNGCTPLDVNRAGMTVGEGAGFLVLEFATRGSPGPGRALRRGPELRRLPRHQPTSRGDGRGARHAPGAARRRHRATDPSAT